MKTLAMQTALINPDMTGSDTSKQSRAGLIRLLDKSV